MHPPAAPRPPGTPAPEQSRGAKDARAGIDHAAGGSGSAEAPNLVEDARRRAERRAQLLYRVWPFFRWEPRDFAAQEAARWLEVTAPDRERFMARLMAVAFTCGLLATCALGPSIGFELARNIGLVVACVIVWEVVALRIIRKGRYFPQLSAMGMVVEVSAPAAMFLIDVQARGATYAMTAPPLVIWAALIGACGLRAAPRLALAAGVLAAVEYAALAFLIAWPRMPPHAILSLEPPVIMTRALLYFLTGVITAAMASSVGLTAAAVAASARERDWMGKYVLERKLGAGGMGEVYRATYCPEGGFRKTVAVKRISPVHANRAEVQNLFRREVAIGALLRHRNVVQVLDAGRFDGHLVMALEYVDGPTLARVLAARGRLAVKAATYVVAELAAGLEYVHSLTDESGEPLGAVHRDVNPPNVFLSRLGEVKLGDFGVVKTLEDAANVAGRIVGKPIYMAPEQLQGSALDARSDLFGLGVTAYEMLVGGEETRDDGSRGSMATRAMEGTILPPSRLRPEVSAQMDALIVRLLAATQADRFPNAAAVRTALNALPSCEAPYPDGLAALLDELREPDVVEPAMSTAPTVPRTRTQTSTDGAETRATPLDRSEPDDERRPPLGRARSPRPAR